MNVTLYVTEETKKDMEYLKKYHNFKPSKLLQEVTTLIMEKTEICAGCPARADETCAVCKYNSVTIIVEKHLKR